MMFNRHVLVDKLMVWTFRNLGKPFFSDSLETCDFEEHLGAIHFDGPCLSTPGLYEYKVRSLGEDTSLQVRLLHTIKPDAPLLIYIMGGGESPFDYTATRAFPEFSGINVVAVEAPYQRNKQQLESAFAKFNNYMAMLAMTVEMNEAILKAQIFASCPQTMIAGTSLGGFIANRHHLIYNSADLYLPMVAGTRHGDIFLTTMKASKPVQRNPSALTKQLNFEDKWLATDHPNVFPHLARFDQLNLLEVQKPSYGEMPIKIWDGGHLHMVKRPELIRDSVLDLFSAHAKVPPNN